MHRSETWQTLLMACEARDIGRPVEAEQLFAEAAPDFEYKRFVTRMTVPKFYREELVEEQRRAWRAEVLAIDWLKWRRRSTVSMTLLDGVLRELYPAEHAAELAGQSASRWWAGEPLTYLERRVRGQDDSNPFVATPKRDTDGIEMRIRSYANVIRPLAYGVFVLPEDP